MKFAEELQEFISKSEHFIQKVHQGEGNFGQRGSGSGGYYGQRGDSGGYYGQRMHNYGRREPGGGWNDSWQQPPFQPQGEMPPQQNGGMYVDPRWFM